MMSLYQVVNGHCPNTGFTILGGSEVTRSWMFISQTLILLLFSSTLLHGGDTFRDHDIVPEDYFDLSTITSCKVSPSGAEAAYVESRWGVGKEGRKSDLWVVNINSKEKLRLTFDGFGAGNVTWSKNGKWIYFSSKGKVWRISPEGGDPFEVTRGKTKIKQFCLASDGKSLFYTTIEDKFADEWKEMRKKFSGIEYGHGISKLNAIWKLDLIEWRTEKVQKADRVIHEIDLSDDMTKIAMITTTDNEIIFKEGWSRVDILHIDSGEIEEVTSQAWRKQHPSPYGWLEDICWSHDNDSLAFSISFDGYPTLIYVTQWMDGKTQVREIKRPDLVACNGGLTWKGESSTLCYKGEVKGRVRAYAVKEVKDGDQGETSILTPGDWVMGDFCFSPCGKVMLAVLGTIDRMGDINLVKDDGYSQVTNVNPQVSTWKLPQISIFSWTGADGDMVEGILELPPSYKKSDGPLPLIVELHGGPTASTKYRIRVWIYGRAVMAARGYALFSPNYHGSTGYGDDFTTKLIGRENEIEVVDIRTGIEALIKSGIADKDRMGVMGWSNGGFLTNSMITSEPNMFKAASSGAGVVDQTLQWGLEDTPGHVINYMQGLPWEKPEAYIKGSPLYNLDKVKTPTIIHVGGNDPRVPDAHSRTLYRGLFHYCDVPVELLVYPGQAHGLGTQEFRLAKIKWDIAWFDKYLLGK